MLHIPYLREHKNEIIEKLKIKNFEANEIIENLFIKDDERKTTQKELDDLILNVEAKSTELKSSSEELQNQKDNKDTLQVEILLKINNLK